MMNQKVFCLFFLTLSFLNGTSRADEGMWIPLYLNQLNEAEMQAMGMRITAEDIYSENHSSLKDAVVIFGGGCTGEVVSPEGLLLTNHHCGYSRIQQHSSLEHDYLTEGFWAMDRSEELPNPGLSVTFLVRMAEVTDRVLEGVSDGMSESERDKIIRENINRIKAEAIEGTHYEAVVKPFFYGNRWFLFVNEVFTDVRLVGAPPSNIGKFGGDTDNWMWPRHTGDFSVFRIYADKDNNPADYSEDNVPYRPKNYLKINLGGVQPGDFTFVFGYPGSTQEYIPADAIDMQVNVINPVRIDLRQKRIDIFKKYMNSDPETRIMYAAKQARISNGWKKWIGENRGVKRVNAIENRRAFEEAFTRWVTSDPELNERYGGLLPAFKAVYDQQKSVSRNMYYLYESGMSVELLGFTRSFAKLVTLSAEKPVDELALNQELASDRSKSKRFFKDYRVQIDKEVFATVMEMYHRAVPVAEQPDYFVELTRKFKNDFEAMSEWLFARSLFSDPGKLDSFLEDYRPADHKKILKDPAFKLSMALAEVYYRNYLPVQRSGQAVIDSLMRIYMKAQQEMQPNRKFYPDANFTLRVAYGNVDGYSPDDAVEYRYYTTLKGIMEKEDPEIYDYVVEPRLKELYDNRDFGRYGDSDGTMHVCFTATNHTTGGNSGSPVLDADGNLIGINFDRCWEGTMSDIVYDISQCRNITLDIRYCLFIIDKYAGAGHLVDEMTLVNVSE
ncbi:MAG: S46 family peptidase [Bacteroidales bacterium]